MEHIELNGRRVHVFVSDDEDPSPAAAFVRKASGYDALARAALSADYGREDSDVVLYIEHHASELGLPDDVTQYVLAVAFDDEGSVVSIDMES